MSEQSALSSGVVFTSLLYLAITFLRFCTALCYFPDGVHLAHQNVPCNEGSNESTCCPPGYACLSNNICMKTNSTLVPNIGIASSPYVRGSCTDPKWISVDCPGFCLGNLVGGEGMLKCEDSDQDSYCCLQGTLCTSKCDQLAADSIIRFAGEPSVVTTIGVSATSSQASSTHESSAGAVSVSQTTTQSGSTSSSAVRQTRSHSSTGLKVEVGVGVPLGLIAIVLAAYVIWRKIRKSKPTPLPLDQGHMHQEKSKDEERHEETHTPAYQAEPLVRHELEWDNARNLPVEADMRHETGH